MKLQLLNEDLTTRIQYLLNKYYRGDTTKQELLQQLTRLDPTPNYQYLEWIVKHHKNGNIRISEDNEKIRQQLQQFHILKNKQKFRQKHSSDITKYTPSTLYNVLADYEGQGQESNRQIQHKTWHGELTIPPGSELILDDGKYQVVKITEVRASEILCTNTNWCTANPERARYYLYGTDDEPGGPLYLVYVDGKKSYLVHYESGQFKYPNDREVNCKLKFELIKLLSPVTGKDQYSSLDLAIWYATRIDRNDKKALDMIVKDPRYAYLYSRAIGERWPEAELYIMKDPEWAYHYIHDVLDGKRWPEAEQTIMKDPIWAYYYTLRIIQNGRWLEAEPYIMKDPEYAFCYARDIIQDRWPEAEPIIMKDPETACYYAKDVIGGRWPEAEPYIMNDPMIRSYYNLNVVQRQTIKSI